MKTATLIIACSMVGASIHAAQEPARNTKKNATSTGRVQAFTATQLIENARQYLLQNQSISQKNDVSALLTQLEHNHHVALLGNDELRARFINTQGCIEQALVAAHEKGEIIQVIGMIHASAPATPLCTKPDEQDQILVDTSYPYGIKSIHPIQTRCRILRNYLTNGNFLYVLYPDGALEKRSTEQQEVYVEELKKHPNLIDWVLTTEKIDPEMIGAMYFYQNNAGKWFTFSVKGRPSNEINDRIEWGMWLGAVEDPIIAKRIDSVFKYLKTCNGPAQSKFFIEKK